MDQPTDGVPDSTPQHGTASDNANASGSSDIDAKINRAITNHIGRLEKRLSQMLTGEALTKAVQSQLEQVRQVPTQAADASDQSPDRITLKSLQEQLVASDKARRELEKFLQEKESQVRDERRRSEVRGQFAKYLGADSPHLDPHFAYQYDLKKRFVDGDNGTMVKIKREWGEELIPLETGVKELFDTELKHLVQSSKAGGLPPASLSGAIRGQSFTVPQPPAGNNGLNPLHQAFLEHLVNNGRGDVAQAIVATKKPQ